MEAVELLKTLVEIPSPSGKEEELLEFLREKIEELGFPSRIFGKDVKNLWIPAKSDLWVLTHLDVVPVDHPFSFDGVYAYGNGVSDAKGCIASLLLFLGRIEELKFNVAFLSDEEEGGRGSKELAERFSGEAIVMEPTELKVAKKHCGSIEILLRVHGTPSHASFPEFAENPIERAFEALVSLEELPVERAVKMIRAGDERHRIPEMCEVSIELIVPPELRTQKILREVDARLRSFGDLEVLEHLDGFIEEGFEILERAMKESGVKPEECTMKSWTDAINLKRAGWRAVVWGPGELPLAHTHRERIRVKEILQASKVLVKLNELL